MMLSSLLRSSSFHAASHVTRRDYNFEVESIQQIELISVKIEVYKRYYHYAPPSSEQPKLLVALDNLGEFSRLHLAWLRSSIRNLRLPVVKLL
jgi:hypothetical protein